VRALVGAPVSRFEARQRRLHDQGRLSAPSSLSMQRSKGLHGSDLDCGPDDLDCGPEFGPAGVQVGSHVEVVNMNAKVDVKEPQCVTGAGVGEAEVDTTTAHESHRTRSTTGGTLGWGR
jgi:hypothetical protein